jgi:hypothetical protein
MRKTVVIILLPVNDYDRIKDAERLENKNYYSLNDIQKEFEETDKDENVLIYTSMSNFMSDCNNEYICLNQYWLTYVNLLS